MFHKIFKRYLQVKPYSLISINEKEELEAQEQLYMAKEMKMSAERARKLEKLRKIDLIYLPLLALIFVVIFWIVGLKNAELL